MPFTGELIAISTVMCWTVSVQFFEAASKKVGATPVNIIRLTTALTLFGFLMIARYGSVLPFHLGLRPWIYLGISGIVGFFVGDLLLFKSLVEIGPRVTMLIFSMSAPTAALIEYFFMDRHYTVIQWTGMLVTLSGVCIVILERNRKTSKPTSLQIRSISLKGILFASGAMLGQAVGYILSKTGMATDHGYIDAFAATQIRAFSAFICFVVLFTVTRKWGTVTLALKNTKAVALTVTGSVIGPFLGVSLSLKVLHYLSVGVASTFLSLVPVFIIPFAIIVHKEYVSPRATAGAVIAVFGIFLLTAWQAVG